MQIYKQYKTIVQNFNSLSILVIGDLMLDAYLWTKVDRISPEAPVPIAHVQKDSATLGGAANVVNNLIALGCSAGIMGVVGTDISGNKIQELLKENKVKTGSLISNENYQTTVKTRVMCDDHQLLRIDNEKVDDIDKKIEEEILKRLKSEISKYHGLIISDYAKGLLTKKVINGSVQIAKKANIPVFVDPTASTFYKYKDVFLIKPNRKETESFLNKKMPKDLIGMEKMLKMVEKKVKAKHVVITLGKDGMILKSKDDAMIQLKVETKEVYDVSGAGDTVLAAIAASMLSGASVATAGEIGNICASIVVGKLGTAVCTQRELLDKIA